MHKLDGKAPFTPPAGRGLAPGSTRPTRSSRRPLSADTKQKLTRAQYPFGQIEKRIVNEALAYLSEDADKTERARLSQWRVELDGRNDLYALPFRAELGVALRGYLPILEERGQRRDLIVLEKLVEQIEEGERWKTSGSVAHDTRASARRS
jgi:hypothetical protein